MALALVAASARRSPCRAEAHRSQLVPLREPQTSAD